MMAIKADSTIKRELGRLRTLIETSTRPSERRVAQAIEFGIMWARHDVRGWPKPIEEALQLAYLVDVEGKG